jgi:hypothetical protein
MNRCTLLGCDLFISWSEGGKRSEIYRRILAQYDEYRMIEKKNVVTNHAIGHA